MRGDITTKGIPVAEIKSFTFAEEVVPDEDIAGQFELNGALFDVRKLKDSALPVLMHKVRNGQPSVVLAAVLDFSEIALTPDSAKRFIEKHLNPVTGLKMGQIVEVFGHIMTVVAQGAAAEDGSTAPKPTPRRPAARR